MTKNVSIPDRASHPSTGEPAISAADEAALNDPIWSALNDRHRVFAWGNDLAMRYRNDIAPFAAVRNSSSEAFAALDEIVAPGDRVALFSTKPRPTLGSFEVFQTLSGVQMVALNWSGKTSIRTETPTIVRMARNDVPEMLQLTRLTNPGPFKERTLELGTYIGVRDRGVLVALAGERMQLAEVCRNQCRLRPPRLSREGICALTGDDPYAANRGERDDAIPPCGLPRKSGRAYHSL